jgi:hypothetical protein
MMQRNRVVETADAILLQYANGKTQAAHQGFSRFAGYVGWHIEARKDERLDEILQKAGVLQINIRHQRQGAPSEVKPHWDLGERVSFFPVTSGPVAKTIAEHIRDADATANAGIGLRWPEGERSKMAIRGYLGPMVKAGDLRLVQISVHSRMTDVLLKALLDHLRVCEAADTIVDRQRHPGVVLLHEIALPLAACQESEEWGKGDTATVTPFQSGHPDVIDAAYIRNGNWRPEALHQQAQQDWPAVVEWAKQFTNQREYDEERL